jgi:acetyltransferase-like isoleucine patch superfamily enzyme
MTFNWKDYIADAVFNDLPWQIKVDEFVRKEITTLDDSYTINNEIAIHSSSIVEEGVVLKSPVIIGPGCFIGAHAYLRSGVHLMGNNSVGPGCELKSCILFPGTNLAHFNFVGDSILGSGVNMEAGSIIANHFNERTDKQISVVIENKSLKTGATKFGSVVGDGCKIGANAVLSPGTILERNTVVARQELVNQNAMKGIQWRDLFVNKGFDLVMVILGITIAFQLENWKVSSDQRSLATFYKESLLVDINSDISELNHIMKELESDRHKVEAYLPRMDQLPADSLAAPLLAILSFETFRGNQNTYQTLIASTGLNTLDDRLVVDKLTEYYTLYTSIRRLESVYTQVILEMNRHFSNHVVYDQRRVLTPQVVSMPATRNYLMLALGQLTSGVNDYAETLEKAQALKAALEKSL